MKVNMKHWAVLPWVMAATIGMLSVLLLVNNVEYRKYRALNEKDITTLNNNIVALESTKTEMETSLEKNIVNLQQEKLKLKTTMDNRVQELKKENEKLRSTLGIKKIAYLRPHDSIDYLSLQYGTKFQPSVGYMGTIKTFDFDNKSYTEVTVLDTEEEWAKISIEAYIPKWYIVDKQDEAFKQKQIMHSIKRKKMYTKEQCNMKLAPDKNSFTQLRLDKGKAVYVTKIYRDWYFIELQQTQSNTDFTQGWVKKSQLGTSKDTEPLEAIIKSGTLVMEYYDTAEQEERILNNDVPVYLVPEKNVGDYIYGKATESWGFWINKRDIDFAYNTTK
jgi:uncharacterized protein YgiM (DUF1202 family)